MYKEKTKRLVLGEGETIGHKHVLQSEKDITYQRAEHSLRLLLLGVGVLTHDEHDRMVFEQHRKYRSYHQQEFNPMDGTTGNMFD